MTFYFVFCWIIQQEFPGKCFLPYMACLLETVQDFLVKLGIKPLMHLLDITIFSLNNGIVELTKIMSKISKFWVSKSFFSVKNWSNLSKKKFCEEYLLRRQTYIDEIVWKLWFLKYIPYFLKMCPIFVDSVHNFGKSDDEIIYWK